MVRRRDRGMNKKKEVEQKEEEVEEKVEEGEM